MNKEMLVWMYCGLSWAQFGDLDSAYHGTLATINGARREAMHPLIGKDVKISDIGTQMWARAQLVMGGDFDGCPDTFAKITDTAKAARLANKGGLAPAGMKLCSTDFKVLRALGQNPGLHWNFLTSVYGYRTVKGLEAVELIKPHCFDERYPKLGWYTLTNEAIRLLEDLNGRA